MLKFSRLLLPLILFTLLFTGCQEPVEYPSYLLPLEEVHFQQGSLPDATYSGTRDTFISNTAPNMNYGGDSIISIGYDENQDKEDRSLVKFDLRDKPFPHGVVVQSAYLYLNMNVKSRDSDTQHKFAAYGITETWYEGGGTLTGSSSSNATWNHSVDGTSWTTPGGDYLSSTQSSVYETPVEDQWISIKLNTAMVQRWIEDSTSNQGVIIKKINNDSSTDITHFHSSEASDAELRPRLSIYYTMR